MLKDIQNREDIFFLMNEFYSKLLADDLIKHFFKDIILNEQLEEHLEIGRAHV